MTKPERNFSAIVSRVALTVARKTGDGKDL
jgi:hypothetical protein